MINEKGKIRKEKVKKMHDVKKGKYLIPLSQYKKSRGT